MNEHPQRAAERLHNEEHIFQPGVTHTTLVWSDGEVNFTKGHELFMSRTLHLRHKGFIPEDQDPGFFPRPRGKTSYAIVKNDAEAEELRDILWEWWQEVVKDTTETWRS